MEVCAILVALMTSLTLVGRQVASLLPYRMRPFATLYLAPLFGLAILVVVSAHLGRFIGFATFPTITGMVTAGAGAWALWRECNRADALLQVLVVAVVSLVAGSAILTCVLRYGGYDTANDTFTYLVNGNWLQHHAFTESIPTDEVRADTTQVVLYQRLGLRMGAIYALGWIQAMAGWDWSYLAYPVALAAAATAFCFATVFIPALIWRVRRLDGYLLAALPGVGLGGVAFSMVKGFLPQTFGLAFALGFLSLGGALFVECMRAPKSVSSRAIWSSSAVLGVLVAAAVMSYSELSPFIGAGIVLAAVIAIASGRSRWLPLSQLAFGTAVVGGALLNWEAWRAVQAVLFQATAVGGWQVDWDPIDYLAHALGVRGGNGDQIGWVLGLRSAGISVTVVVLALIVTAWLRRSGRRLTLMLPLLCFGVLCVAGFVYFRYFVPSPFQVGTGHSWNQFKLAGWIYPVSAVLIIGSAAWLASRVPARIAAPVMLAIVAAGLIHNHSAARPRTAHIVAELDAAKPIYLQFLEIRTEVKRHVHPGETVYLGMTGHYHKLRQMMAYFLHDVDVVADWRGDAYIEETLPKSKLRVSRRSVAYMLVPRVLIPVALRQKGLNGNSPIILLNRPSFSSFVVVDSASGGYDRESDGSRWWYWVESSISFDLDDLTGGQLERRRRISGEYGVTGERRVTLSMIGTRNRRQDVELPAPPSGKGTFDVPVPDALGRLERIVFSGSGDATTPGPNDGRSIRFLVGDVAISIARPKVVLTSARGGYDREARADRWWYWVKDRIVFDLADAPADRSSPRRLSADYLVHGDQRVVMSIVGTSGRRDIELPKPSRGMGTIDLIIPPELGTLEKIEFVGVGEPTKLGPQDARLARFQISNLDVNIETPPTADRR